jgi:hypothetical protein
VSTRFPDLFAALATPFEPSEVKVRSQAGRQFHYITARTAMNRLDTVLGPENWFDEYFPQENSVLCKLTIRLPDGALLTKADAGGYAGMADQGDDDKSGYSDAFKRACVKFGIARYLYRDGVPSYPAAADADQEGGPKNVRELFEARLVAFQMDLFRGLTTEGLSEAEAHRRIEAATRAKVLPNKHQVANALATLATKADATADGPLINPRWITTDRTPAGPRDKVRTWKALEWAREHHPTWLSAALEAEMTEKTAAFRAWHQRDRNEALEEALTN